MRTKTICLTLPLVVLTAVSFTPVTYAEDLSDIVAQEAVQLGTGLQFTEGPVWHKDGYVLFSDIPANHIMKWSASDGLSIWREDSGNSNGLTFDNEGRLIACEHGNRRVSRTESDGSTTVIASHYDGKRLNSPNDCDVRSDGMIFFTDPSYGVQESERELDFKGVFRVMPGEDPVLLIDDFVMPNGICFSPDEKLVYIADSDPSGNEIRVYKVQDDGTLTDGKKFADHGSDGMKVDVEGRLYTTTRDGVVVYSPDGTRIGAIKVGEHPANCGFGGPENRTLYITARNGFYAVKLKTPGVPVWSLEE